MKLLKYLFFIFSVTACQMHQKWDYPFPFVGLALDGFPVTEETIHRLKDETKINPALIVFYMQWPSSKDTKESILPSLDAIWNSHAVPCMTWEPFTLVDQVEITVAYHDILSGKYDNYLEWMATELKSWEKPIIIRFAQEMNISRYHWGTQLKDYGSSSTNIYASMFRYVVTFFRNKQVDNVLWAFCPNAESVPKADWNVVKNYYPGDQYVDILGMDGYNWDIDAKLAEAKGQTWITPWRSFKELFESIYQQLKQISANKPLIIFETASVDRSNEGRKNLWMEEALKVSKQWNIQGIIWFQINKEEDWKLKQVNNTLVDPQQPSFQDWFFKNYKDFR